MTDIDIAIVKEKGLPLFKRGVAHKDINCKVLSHDVMYIMEPGTTVLVDSFRDEALRMPHPFPVIANHEGVFDDIYVVAGIYKIVIKDNLGSDVAIHPAIEVGTVFYAEAPRRECTKLKLVVSND